ncbi:MAG: hypothetical protein B7Z20_10405 [Sphingobium sp. 32-64-5]|nr:MAG: hypothetical protein B7Z20_10405 [Sphingobium sp. 32-64-5]
MMMTGLLFSFALVMALGTIIGMARAYHGKAVAALFMEHQPMARTEHGVATCYSPARRPRTGLGTPSPARRSARRSVRAA